MALDVHTELHFAVCLGQYFVMMSPSDVSSSSSLAQRAVARLPLSNRPTVASGNVLEDRRKQTHKEGTIACTMVMELLREIFTFSCRLSVNISCFQCVVIACQQVALVCESSKKVPQSEET